MPQTRDNGAKTPINADAYNLTADLATMADSLGVITPVNTDAQRDALTKFNGRAVTRMDVTGAPLEIWDGAVWRRIYTGPYAITAGSASIGIVTAGNTSGPFGQTFPAGRFTQPPIVLLSTDQTRVTAVAANIVASGFNLYLGNYSTGNSANGNVYWTAIQMTPTTAAG
jgi:hypothetical protein